MLSKPSASFPAACYRVGPDGRHGSAPPADASGSMGRAISEAALYTQLSALHRCLVRAVTLWADSCFRRELLQSQSVGTAGLSTSAHGSSPKAAEPL